MRKLSIFPVDDPGPYPLVEQPIISKDTIFFEEQTCAGICSARELVNQGRIKAPKPLYLRDQHGFLWCNCCRRPLRSQLKKCPECGNYFRGPRPYKPVKIDYECEKCE